MTLGKSAGTVCRVVIATIFVSLSFLLGRCHNGDFQGVEIIRSEAPNYPALMVVRRFGDYKPRYLCKYYSYGQLISAQSYYARGKSEGPARTAVVKWNKSGATVYLDDTPVLELSGGIWTELKIAP